VGTSGVAKECRQSTSPRSFRKAALPATPFKGSTTPAGDILLVGENKFLRGLHDAGIPVGCPHSS
jgi:hypothetical protein